MRNALILFAVVAALGIRDAVLAQDRPLGTLRESAVRLEEIHVRPLPDAGCELMAFPRTDAGVERDTSRTWQPYNGARCTVLRGAALQAAKNDLSVGDGSDP